MPVFASLVVGADGSTSKAGSSRLITSGIDRTTFLERRRGVDFILIGGRTARAEPYNRTPVPVVIASHSMINSLANNRLAYWWNCSPLVALEKGKAKFGESVLVEGGAAMIETLMAEKALDGIYLSITTETGGADFLDYHQLISQFQDVQSKEIEKTLFIEAKTRK